MSTKRKLMKAILATVALSALLLVTACGSNNKDLTAWEKIQKNGELVVATSGTLFPTSYHDNDNNLTGYDVEIVKEVAKRLNLKVKFVEMAFDGMLTSINSGQVDAAANDIGVNEERKDKFSFTDSYKYSFGSAVVRKDDLSGIETLEDLKGKKAAGESTTVYMQIAREYGAEEVTYDNATNELYLRDVSIGRTDVILNDYYLQSLALTVFPELNITIHPGIRYRPSEAAMILKKGNEDVIEKINEVLKEMREDGTISELSKQFFGGADVSIKQDLDFE